MPADPTLTVSPPAPLMGKKTVVMDIPIDLWLWVREQTYREGSDLTKKTIALYKQWKAEVEAAQMRAKAKPTKAKAKKPSRSPQDKKQRK